MLQKEQLDFRIVLYCTSIYVLLFMHSQFIFQCKMSEIVKLVHCKRFSYFFKSNATCPKVMSISYGLFAIL